MLLPHAFIKIAFITVTDRGGFYEPPARNCDIVFVGLSGKCCNYQHGSSGRGCGCSSANENMTCAHLHVCERTRDLRAGFRICREEKRLCANQPKASCCPNCSPQTPAQLVVFFFFILVIFPSSLTFQLPYFVILRSLPGGNFCAGYDLKELANHGGPSKLEQDVTKGPGPMVSGEG